MNFQLLRPLIHRRHVRHVPPPVLHWRGLRNLNDFQRVEIARKLECAVRARAKERQGERNDLHNIVPDSARSRDELAGMVGVGHSTYEHAVTVLDRAPPRKPVDERKQETGI